MTKWSESYRSKGMVRRASNLLFFFVVPLWAAANPRFIAVGNQQSIPDGVVTSLAADPQGYLWIGTTRGLVRFDGYEFYRFLNDPSDPKSPGGNLVRSLHMAHDGRLWVGFDPGLVSVLEPGGFRTFEFASPAEPKLAGAAAMDLASDGKGQVFVALRSGGLGFIKEAVEAKEPQVGLVEFPEPCRSISGAQVIHAVALGSDGWVWLGSEAGLLRWDGQGACHRVWTGTDEGRSDPVYSLLSFEGRIWAGTVRGRLLYVDGERPVVVEDPGRASLRLRDTFYDFLAVPEAEELWVARASAVEVRALNDGRLVERLEPDPLRATALRAPDLRALALDAAGLIWVGGFGGGVQWHDPRSRWLEVLDRLRGQSGMTLERPNLGALLVRREGTVLLGLRGEGLALLDSELQLVRHWSGQEEGEPHPWHWTTALAEDPGGMVFIGTRDGLYRWSFDRGWPEPVLGGEHLEANRYIRRLFFDRLGRLWVGTGNGAFWIEDPATKPQWHAVATTSGMRLQGEVNAFVEDRDGNIWLGGGAGLLRGRAGEPFERLLLFGRFRAVVGLLLDPQGRLWIDTNDSLYRREPDGTIRDIGKVAGLGRESFGANLLFDPRGRLWSHRYVLDTASGWLEPLPSNLELDFGTGWFRAYTAMPDGRLLFGGSRGVLVVHPERYAFPPPLPRPLLSEASVGGRSVSLMGKLTIPPELRAFTIRFSCPDAQRGNHLRYRFRLVGSEAEWNAVDSDQRVASYRSLPPGLYRFEVQAGDRRGWSELQSLPIEVLPFWWERSLFRGFFLLTVVLLVAVIWRVRVQVLKKQARELEQRVAARTAELSAARDRAEQALAELERAQAHLIQSETMASLGRMVAGLAHEINTPLGIALTAMSHLKNLQEERFRLLASGQLRKSEFESWKSENAEGFSLIESSLERAARLVKSLKQVSVDQASERRRQFSLSSLLDELRVAFSHKLKRSPHRFETDCAEDIQMDSYPGALFQVLSNLIENAINHAFTDNQSGRIRIEARRKGDTVRLVVSDDGVGMTPEVAAHAFEPFFTTAHDRGGTGLGLHLVYNLSTVVLGGEIELETAPNQGTRFYLALPCTAPLREKA